MSQIGCKIGIGKNNLPTVVNDSGNTPQLFKDLLDYFSFLPEVARHNKAVETWAIASTDAFNEVTGKDEDTATAKELFTFLKDAQQQGQKLSPDNLFEVRHVMSTYGFNSLSELSTQLEKIFRKDGISQVDFNQAIKSGLYGTDDIRTLNIPLVLDLMDQVQGELMVGNNFEVEPQETYDTYERPQGVLNIPQKITLREVVDRVKEQVQDFSNEQEILEAIQEVSPPAFQEKFDTNEEFRREFLKGFEGMRRVPVQVVENGELVSLTKRQSLLRNTFPANLDITRINARFKYLQSIPELIWLNSTEELKRVLDNLESYFIEQGIDVIGLKDMSQENALRTLNATIESAQTGNTDILADTLDSILGAEQFSKIQRFGENLKDTTLLYIDSELSQQELFEQQGLIKVKGNIYQKVSLTEPIQDIYSYIEDTPAFKQRQDKKQTVEQYVRSLDQGLPFKNDRAQAYRIVFEHEPLPKQDVSSLQTLDKERTEYLKNEYPLDFYKDILRGKKMDTLRHKFNKWTINGQDIVPMDDVIAEDIPPTLIEYAKLSRNEELRQYLPEMNDSADPVLQAINFPEQTPEHFSQYKRYGTNILTPRNSTEVIKINGELYALVGQDDMSSVYSKLVYSKQDNRYFTTEAFAQTNQDQINELLDLGQRAHQSIETADELNKKTGLSSPFMQHLQEVAQRPQEQEQPRFSIAAQELSPQSNNIGSPILQQLSNQLLKLGTVTKLSFLSPKQLQDYLTEKGISVKLAQQVIQNYYRNENRNVQNFFVRKIYEQESDIATKNKVVVGGKTFTVKKHPVKGYILNNKEHGDVKLTVYGGKDTNRLETKSSFEATELSWVEVFPQLKDVDTSYANLKKYIQANDVSELYPIIEADNYHIATKGDFSKISEEDYNKIDAEEYVSDFGSRYKVKDNTLYRKADHWGSFATVTWTLDGRPTTQKYIRGKLQNITEAGKIPLQNLKRVEGVVTILDEKALERAKLQVILSEKGLKLTPQGLYNPSTREVIVNEQAVDPVNTMIHEFAHAFFHTVREKRPDVYQAGMNLVNKNKKEAQAYIDLIKQTQPDLVEGTQEFSEEVLVSFITDSKRLKRAPKNKLEAWLQNFWEAIRDVFGITSYTATQISQMTLTQFSDAVLKDMFSGESIDKIYSVTEKENMIEELVKLKILDKVC
jgi:hypothetical protein